MSTNSSSTVGKRRRRCQVVVLGAHRLRVAKVVSLLARDGDTTTTVHNDDDVDVDVDISYLPCVATFDAYEDGHGATVRYLVSVEHHHPGVVGAPHGGGPKSLAPFVDDDDDGNDNLGIVAVAVGCGVDAAEDVDRVRVFMAQLLGDDDAVVVRRVPTDTDRYADMREENEAYRALDAQAKERAASARTIGPGKMAAFAATLARARISAVLGNSTAATADKHAATQVEEHMTQADKVMAKQEEEQHDTTPDNTIDAQETAHNNSNGIQEHVTEAPSSTAQPPPSLTLLTPDDLIHKEYYSCRMCRTPLFTEDHVENPPHHPAQHGFGRHQRPRPNNNNTQHATCQSVFLSTDDLPVWLDGVVGDAMEGRIVCPKPGCGGKVGTWKWAGTQCSCGTWVTPAVQFAAGRVDRCGIVPPTSPILPNVVYRPPSVVVVTDVP